MSTRSRGSRSRKIVGPKIAAKIAAARSHRHPGLGQPQESRTLGSSSRPWDGEKNTRGPKKQPWLGQARALGSKSNFGDGQAKHRGPKKLPLLGQTGTLGSGSRPWDGKECCICCVFLNQRRAIKLRGLKYIHSTWCQRSFFFSATFVG